MSATVTVGGYRLPLEVRVVPREPSDLILLTR